MLTYSLHNRPPLISLKEGLRTLRRSLFQLNRRYRNSRLRNNRKAPALNTCPRAQIRRKRLKCESRVTALLQSLTTP